jgi:hypothetical protein
LGIRFVRPLAAGVACALAVVACRQEQHGVPPPATTPPGTTSPATTPPATAQRVWPPTRTGYSNPIPVENALPGNADWLSGVDAASHQLEGYADRISARAGETVQMQISADVATTATWTLYRLGWYGGTGARAVQSGGPISIGPQPACPVEPGTGLVRCSWTPVTALEITPAEVSGYYAFKLTRQDGKTRFIPFFVIDDRPADLLFQTSVQTYQAYNAWGGESF